jgi:hypothetical protein
LRSTLDGRSAQDAGSRNENPLGVSILNVFISDERKNQQIICRNWGLTDFELKTIPPALIRSFQKNGQGGFGSEMPGNFGRLLMRDAPNSALYGPLQAEYEKGQAKGTDVWIHKNR